MSAEFFNPNQIEIVGFSSRLLDRPPGGPARFALSVDLKLGEARGVRFQVNAIRLEAEAASIETLTQHKVVELLLDAVIAAVQREREGSRPGMPRSTAPEPESPPIDRPST